MTKEAVSELLRKHPFFDGLTDVQIEQLAACGAEVGFKAGQHLGRQGDDADQTFAIYSGVVAIETFVPHEGPVMVQTLSAGDVVGWSWIVPPHRWMFDARAVEAVRAIALNGDCLREQCERDPQLGYRLLTAFVQDVARRFQATRIQLLDLYGRRAK